MGSIVALICWMFALVGSLILRRRGLVPMWSQTLIIVASLLVLLIGDFWRSALLLWQAGGEAMLAPADSAFLCVWVLVLLPIARRRLDGAVLVNSLVNGLIALCAVGLAADSIGTLAVFAQTDAGAALALALGVTAVLFFAGFVCCLARAGSSFPWEYGVWFAGLLLIAVPAQPALDVLALDRGYGAGALGGAFVMSLLLFQGLRRGDPKNTPGSAV